MRILSLVQVEEVVWQQAKLQAINKRRGSTNNECILPEVTRSVLNFPSQTSLMLKSAITCTIVCVAILSCKQPQKPLTKEESLEFAKKVQQTIERKDATFLDKAISPEALFTKMDLPNKKDSRSFEQGARKGMDLGTKILATMSDKGSYSFIKHYTKDSLHHVLFRLYDQGMINYHDMELTRVNGEAKIADMYIYLTGENFSETMKTLYSEFTSFEEKGSTQNSRWMQEIPKIRNLITEKKYQEALDIFNSMPLVIQNSRPFQIINVEIASGISDEDHIKAVERYEALYPNEPNMQLMLIDAYVLRQQYDKALKAVNELDRMIDKDPLLDYYRAICYNLLNDQEKFREHLELLVKNIPDFEDGLIELINDYLENEEYEKARPLIKNYQSRKSFDQSALTDVLDAYPNYIE
jgi:tetratricopeptide (TPR) repeat protein